MRDTQPQGSGRKDQRIRASISFPPDLYEALEQLAKKKKVSLAWVVRDAAERYIEIEAKGTTERGTS